MLTFITSISDKRNFYEFIGVFRKHLDNFYGSQHRLIVNYVSSRDKQDPIVLKIKKFCDKLYMYRPINGIDDGNYAKVLRFIKASEMEQERVILMDVDIFMLNHEFFNNIFYTNIGNKIGTVGKNIYAGTRDSHKFPMSYCFGSAENFREIVNPDGLPTDHLIEEWSNHDFSVDKKEFINQKHDNFSDESLFHLLTLKSNKVDQFVHFDRPDVNRKYGVARRIDRANWSFDPQKYEQSYYIDCCPIRPLNENYTTMKDVIDIITEYKFGDFKI